MWYRPQLSPGGGYGPWTKLSDQAVRPKYPLVLPVENVDGRIEAFVDIFPSSTYRVYQSVPDGPWTGEVFSLLASPPYWGGPTVITLNDGRLAYAQTTQHVDGHELGTWYVTQTSPASAWGTWQYLGQGPFQVAVTYPSMTVAPDNTVHVTAAMWSATRCVAHIDQLPTGGWSPWRVDPASSSGCPLP